MTLRKQSTLPAPPALASLFRIVNLLPRSTRSPNTGIHELSERRWFSDGRQDVVRDWFYFWRYIDPLPIELQAFVLYDELYMFETTEIGMASVFDPHHYQALNNLEFPDCPPTVLRDVVSNARKRIDTEITMFEENKAVAGQRSQYDARPAQWRQYDVAGSTFGESGADVLYRRARERFFFLLHADEILHALTTVDPKSHLETLLYEDECAMNGYLFVKDGSVQLEPPALFSLLVGTEVSRIRRCEICESYFWAGRKDKLVCSLQCGATKRKRQERKRYSDKKTAETKGSRKSLLKHKLRKR